MAAGDEQILETLLVAGQAALKWQNRPELRSGCGPALQQGLNLEDFSRSPSHRSPTNPERVVSGKWQLVPYSRIEKHALCDAEEEKAQNFAEGPLIPADLQRDDGHPRLLREASAMTSSSPHLLALEAADHEGVALPALGWSSQLPEPVGLRCAGEEDVLKLLLGCTVFCGNSIKV